PSFDEFVELVRGASDYAAETFLAWMAIASQVDQPPSELDVPEHVTIETVASFRDTSLYTLYTLFQMQFSYAIVRLEENHAGAGWELQRKMFAQDKTLAEKLVADLKKAGTIEVLGSFAPPYPTRESASEIGRETGYLASIVMYKAGAYYTKR